MYILPNNVNLFIKQDEIEAESMRQIMNVSAMPFIDGIAIMPDVHAGRGSSVGTVIATQGAICPSVVGVDIGCGMCAVKLPFTVSALGDNLDELRTSIERSIPVGFLSNTERNVSDYMLLTAGELGLSRKQLLQLGTLGGGNHFIEICQDQYNGAWLILHSGSRNMGKTLAEVHIEKAKGLMRQYFIDLPDPDLAYFAQGTSEFDAYISDLHLAQAYAKANRHEMVVRALRDISYYVHGEDVGESKMTLFKVDCHHNYVQIENHHGKNLWVIRKGAVSAREGQFGIIPGSMGTKSYIVSGKGNPASYNSCSHGAGRRMSRTQARKQFTLDDFVQQTNGVSCRKDIDVLDEIPGAYKDIDKVMAYQADLVNIEYTLQQLICIKG